MPLVHVSERFDIERFAPRVPPGAGDADATPVVWAVAESHLVNYLVPRDCPRVTFRAGPRTTRQDRERFLGAAGAAQVVAIETGWLERALATPLCLYEMPEATFACSDATAGYFVSATAVVPVSRRIVERPLVELTARDAELRVRDKLQALAAEVAASTLDFSCIRMRNARH
jgi:hypothetical protein